MFDFVALWAFAQVMKLVVNIQQTFHIISNITSRQGPTRTSIPKGPYWTLHGHFALTLLDILTLKWLCKDWEVLQDMEMAILLKVTSWESSEQSNWSNTSKEAMQLLWSSSFTLHNGNYLPFITKVAHLIVYCIALHFQGWIHVDYDLDFQNFYDIDHSNALKEFSDKSFFKISNKIQGIVLSKLCSNRLKQQLQNSLEKFLFILVLPNHFWYYLMNFIM